MGKKGLGWSIFKVRFRSLRENNIPIKFNKQLTLFYGKGSNSRPTKGKGRKIRLSNRCSYKKKCKEWLKERSVSGGD